MNSAFGTTREFAIPDLAGEDPATDLRELMESIFDSMNRPVFHYLLSLVANTAEAEDLTQEVFLRLCSELRAGRPIENVRPWCFKVAHNLAASAGRRKQTEEHFRSASGEPESYANGIVTSGIEEALVKKEQSRRVAAAMVKLSEMERQCLYLRTEGLLYREIADILNVRIPTVQTFLARAMKKVVKELYDLSLIHI